MRHTFTEPERNAIGGDLARAIAESRGIAAEFDQVKADYKAKTAAADSKIDSLSTSLMNGFELRKKRLVVVLMPKERRRHLFLEGSTDTAPVLIEEMTPSDYQEDLIRAESRFDLRTELPLFMPVGPDSGVLVVGRLGGNWFGALRVKIGTNKLEERLDSEQPSNKHRIDAVRRGVERFQEWILAAAGKDVAKGFSEYTAKVIEANKELAE